MVEERVTAEAVLGTAHRLCLRPAITVFSAGTPYPHHQTPSGRPPAGPVLVSTA